VAWIVSGSRHVLEQAEGRGVGKQAETVEPTAAEQAPVGCAGVIIPRGWSPP
jgi:hypothetical protein